MSGHLRWLWLVLLALPFAWPAMTDGVYVGNGTDLYSYQLPMRRALRALLSSGELPTWNPWVLGGVPLIAGMQLGVFYPPNWLTAWMPPERGLELSLLLHGVWLSLGAVALSHVLRGRRALTPDAPAILTAAVFSCAGQLWGHVFSGHVSYWQAWSWTPWIWACALYLQAHPSLRATLVLCGAAAAQVLAGHPQVSYLSAVALTALLLWRWWAAPQTRRMASPLTLLAAAIGAAALAAVQLLPTATLAPELNRSLADAATLPLAFSAPPETLLTSIAWDAFGGPSPRLTTFSYHEPQAFLGAAVLCLSLIGFVSVPTLWPLSLFAALCVGLSLGSNGPVMPSLLGVFPGLDLFRVPPRWLLPVTGLCAVASGQAVHHLAHGRSIRRPMAALIAVAVAVVALSLALTVDADEGWWREHITRPQRAESLPAVVDALLTHLWLCVLVSLGVGYLWWRGRLTAVGQWLLVAVVVAEGLWFCSAHLERRFHWPQARVDWSPGLAQSLQKVSHGGRLATSPRLRHANWGGAHHVAVAGGYETAVPLWTNVYLNRAARRRTMRYAVNLQTGRDSPLLDRLAARHYLRRANERRLKGWKEVARSSGLALDRNPTPLPRAHFADQVRVETSRAKAMERLEKLPLTVTVLGDKLPHQPGGQAEIVGARWGGAEISLQTRTDRPKVLVIRDALAPGWSATIDDAPAQLTLADGLFRGVAVPAGEHTVMMRYRAPGLRLGGWTSVIGWALWLLLLVGAGRLSRREP